MTYEIQDIVCLKTCAIEEREHNKRPTSERKGTSQHEKDRWESYPKDKSHIPPECAGMLRAPTIEDWLQKDCKEAPCPDNR